MNHREIFDKYLDDRCPLCDGYVDAEDNQGHTEHGGKCMAKHFVCPHCDSHYTVGFNRSRYPIESEIIINNYKKPEPDGK
jgi:transposase-like protein